MFLGPLPQRSLRGAALLLFLALFGPFTLVVLVEDAIALAFYSRDRW
jgi:hypothetical protein